MSIWKRKSTILVTCPRGVVSYLRAEIEGLNFTVLNEIDTAIQIEGTLEDAVLLNLHLRTAQRVLYQLQTFKVISPQALYEGIRAIAWEELLYDSGPKAYVCITSVVDNPLVTDSRFVNLKVKDAIVDRIREKRGARPDSGPDKGKAVIHVYWRHDQATVYIDTSGERLSLRGYRKIPLQAPMQEILAAALILATGWSGRTPFVNPMCGSGTLAIEAALIALNRAPGLERNNYGFMYIKEYKRELWQGLQRKARIESKQILQAKIIATDNDEASVQAARLNAQTAGVLHLIDFMICPFEKTPIPAEGGIIMVNPPYGERLEPLAIKTAHSDRKKERNRVPKTILRKAGSIANKDNKTGSWQRLERLYEGCGDYFKSIDRGYRGYVFTGNPDMIKKVGLRTKRRLTFYNGEIECRLLEYELYAGSRKNAVQGHQSKRSEDVLI